MLNKFKHLHGDSEEGFTLVELLVVIIIIGLLAAIALPIFLNQQTEAIKAAVKSDVKSAQVALSSWLVKNPTATNFNYEVTGTYASGSLATTEGLGLIPLSNPKNQIKIRGYAGAANYGSWNDYVIIGWNNDLGLSAYRYSFASPTGKYYDNVNV